MSDNISADEVKRRLVIFLRIPAEVWTDVLKLLPRRILIQNIAPACFRLKEISNKNVKNIHMIKKAYELDKKVDKDDPEANQQLEHLAGNKCQLARQFRLTFLSISDEKSQAILRHCPDLFDGCKIYLYIDQKNKDSTVFLECLTELEMAKPIRICVNQLVDQVDLDFWHHPTFLDCTRVDLLFWPCLSSATLTTAFVNVFDWLHHHLQPRSGAADQQQVRCMIALLNGRKHIDWLLDRCTQDIQQAHGPADRRPFVLSFHFWYSDWTRGFSRFRRVENKSTGEVLVLDRFPDEDGDDPIYRLRRCLAEEEANGPEAAMFKRDNGYEAFNIDIDETPGVMIG